MESVPQLPAVLRTVLTQTADTAARATGFVQRRSKLTGGHFVQALTFGWLANPAASLAELAHLAAVLGVPITPQGLAQRFTAAAAACLQQVLQQWHRRRDGGQHLLGRLSAAGAPAGGPAGAAHRPGGGATAGAVPGHPAAR